jgi:dTDP-4-amino-4,6-dideoxyglucose formyltransferase
MKTLMLTDNQQALDLARDLAVIYGDIDIFQSPNGLLSDTPRLNVRDQITEIIQKYNLVISIHCKQFFPTELIKQVRCINVHPGFNPFNRGWFPGVFSIINGLKAGVTIHEMDEELDHGPIIVQREYKIRSWDTSGSAYENIMTLERELLTEHFYAIREGTYRVFSAESEGNINFKKDFQDLLCLDLQERMSFQGFINRIRALTHGEYRNAYFIDETGKRVFVRIILEPEGSEI